MNLNDLGIKRMEAVWTLDQGINAARALNEIANIYGYHLALGGSVLIKGESLKDLDLYAFPLHTDIVKNPDGLMQALRELDFAAFNKSDNPEYELSYAEIWGLIKDKKAIDLFIIQE